MLGINKKLGDELKYWGYKYTSNEQSKYQGKLAELENFENKNFIYHMTWKILDIKMEWT